MWSFLMASAHGAGLMLVPVLMYQPMLAQPLHVMSHPMAGVVPAAPGLLSTSVIALAVLIHTVSMLAVAGILAVVFFETYEKVGLRLLRHTWINFDLLWAIVLIASGLAALLL